MLEVKVTRKHQEAEGICSFELSRVDGEPLPAFTACAHIDVHVAPGLTRQYSLCNPPQERHRYVIAVLREPASRGGSHGMHELLQVGGTLAIGEPRNLFELVPDADRYLLFAGGIGITPILAMAWSLAHQGRAFELHYCSRSAERAAFVRQLAEAPFANRVHTHFDDGSPGQKLDVAAVLGKPLAGQHVYVCGPGGFMDFILGAAATFGWPAEQVHREYFAVPQPAHDANQAFEVELARSGRVLEIPADKSVFEVLDAAGVQIDTSCEQGICGCCLTRVMAGIPDHRDQFMTDAERALNNQFTPCCSRSRSPRLVLDL